MTLTWTSGHDHAPALVQAGFWRRVLALTIDGLLIAAVLALAGMLLFDRTDGRIRVGYVPLVGHEICRSVSVDATRAQLRLPENFNPSRAEACVSAVAFIVHDRKLVLTSEHTFGAFTRTWSVTRPLDGNGRLAEAFYLDRLFLALLVLYLLVFEWLFGATPGKRLLGVRLRIRDGTGRPFVRILKRVLFRLLPVLACLLLVLAASAWDGALLEDLRVVAAVVVLVAALAGAQVIDFLRAVLNDDLPWHDRWAGTEAVCLR
jgi:uncharacterized RDD family membrane protein YckC